MSDIFSHIVTEDIFLFYFNHTLIDVSDALFHALLLVIVIMPSMEHSFHISFLYRGGFL